MKKPYPENWLLNEQALQLGAKLRTQGKLTDAQWSEIARVHTEVPYQPNVFIKILLLIFGGLGYGFGLSLISIFIGYSGRSFTALATLYGLGMLVFLWKLIQRRRLHFSGLDNALLYCILGSFLPLLWEVFEVFNIEEVWQRFLCFLPLLGLATYFFGEPLVACITYLTFLTFVAALSLKHPVSESLLPFILMLISWGVYVGLRWIERNRMSYYWYHALNWVQLLTLTTGLIATNYHIVREANAELKDLSLPAPEIPFATLFWILTFLIPLAYGYMGFRQKQRSLMVLAVIGFLGAFLTFRQYHALLPLEWALTLGGGLGIIVTIGLIRWLKTPQKGLMYQPETFSEATWGLQTLMLSQLAKNIQNTDQGVKLGGGDFGGGGAGEKYE